MIELNTYLLRNLVNPLGIVLLFLFSSVLNQASAQSLPVGFPVYEDYLRREQLMGNIDSMVSFTVRPLQPTKVFGWKSAHHPDDSSQSKLKGHIKNFSLLPVTYTTQVNSHHPTGTNDGSLIPNKGIQKRLSGGFYYASGKWGLQFMPEIVFAQNASFDEFTEDHFEVIWGRKYVWWNQIDAPVRFGNGPHFMALPGQSSLRYNFQNFSVGLSTENLWWGPGKRNSLLMSNHAAGFPHLTFNTAAPVITSIGSFEGQFIVASLSGSGFNPPRPETEIFFRSNLHHPKRKAWRYLSGVTATWQPKWVPGLFAGYSKVSQVYHDELKRPWDFVPFFNSSERYDLDFDLLTTYNQSLSSVFLRWLLHQSQAEFYVEYGTNGNSKALREFVEQPYLNRAFTIGLSKIYQLNKLGYMQFELEATQLGQVDRKLIRNSNSWYIHPHIRHGYTHQGQVIGAGIGPGSNVQYISVSWFNRFNRIGIFGERLVHNNDSFYFTFEDSNDWRRFWTDLSTGILFDWRHEKLLISSHLRFTRSWNYQWFLKQNPGDPYFISGRNVNNFHASINLAYVLN